MRPVRALILMAALIASIAPPATAAARSVFFAGQWWDVRDWSGGPGNGCWNSGTDSVWVDASGYLHLKIRQVQGTWCQAEVVSQDFAGYGAHRFKVISRLDQLDPDVILGMFLYKDDETEIDIEIADSFDATPNRGWYVVQPGTEAICTGGASRCSFPIAMTGTYSTHSFHWSAGEVDFESWHGHCDSPPCGGIMKSWSYAGPNVPAEAEALRTHINFWVCAAAWCPGDHAPDSEQEVIIADYTETADPAVPALHPAGAAALIFLLLGAALIVMRMRAAS